MLLDNLPTKVSGVRTNFKVMGHYTMNIHNHYKNLLIIEILIMLKSIIYSDLVSGLNIVVILMKITKRGKVHCI